MSIAWFVFWVVVYSVIGLIVAAKAHKDSSGDRGFTAFCGVLWPIAFLAAAFVNVFGGDD